MTNEREPLWSDERIMAGLLRRYADDSKAITFYRALLPFIAEITGDYEAALANQYQRIERFVELVDQLERKLAEATEANSSCALYIASQMERIGDLEAQLAQRWQPVAANFILTHDTGLVDTPKQFVRWNADDESIITGEDNGNFYHCPVPDNIRLCRLVTQEPTL